MARFLKMIAKLAVLLFTTCVVWGWATICYIMWEIIDMFLVNTFGEKNKEEATDESN